MAGFLIKALVSGLIIALVTTVAPRLPRIGALILSLPLISVVAILMLWFQERNLSLIAQFSRETLILVPLGLGFFIPLALATKLGFGFWPAFFGGLIFASLCILVWWFTGKST